MVLNAIKLRQLLFPLLNLTVKEFHLSESLFHKLFYYDCWSIAWRKISDVSCSVPNDKEITKYHVINAGNTHWEADPFLFEKDGNVYLFFEYMPYHSHHGVIAYRKFDGNDFSEPVVCLRTDSHLSYPDIFESNGSIYMIPESINDKSVCLFECKHFPDKWALKSKLIQNVCFVDSTVYQNDKKDILYLYDPDEPNHKVQKLYLAELDAKKSSLTKQNLLYSYSEKLGRPAGKIFKLKNKESLRPTQDCRGIYGGSIRFMKVEKDFKEKEYSTLSVEGIQSDLKYKGTGLHTFNRCNNLEVIDLFYSRFSLLKPIRGILKKITK